LQEVCPVCVGEFLNAVTGEFDAPVPVTPAVEEVEEGEVEDVEDVEDEEELPDVVSDELVSRLLSPGDCPGVMNGDCGVLVR
jgi:hypothetical protein